MSQIGTLKSTLCVTLIVVFISSGFCCTDEEWRCKSGECISVYEQCNGIVECKDESDETAESCLQEPCPPPSYRCAYGACVAANAKCNGIRECADGSDEASALCGFNTIKSTKCLDEEFQCDSGECIDEDKTCNGNSDCPDQSDETVEICANSCPEHVTGFRCGYGACIDTDKVCNGIPDCRDGSDESFSLCGTQPVRKPTPSPPTKRPPGPTLRPTTTTPKPPLLQGCIAPSISNSLLVYETDETKLIRAGNLVPEGISMAYKCMIGYSRVGLRTNLCFNFEWYYKPEPECIKFCAALEGATFRTECELNGAWAPCSGRIRPGTIARIFCLPKYKKPSRSDVRVCQNDGEWDYEPYRCEPVCGEELTEVTEFVWNGVETNITKVPWHVGIYQNFRLNGNYVHHCGGTLINAKVIISAAHCFWDKAGQRLYDHTLFLVGAGKYFRDYGTREPNAHYQNISNITIPFDVYTGDTHNTKGDIAVVVLTNYFRFSSYIAPICLEWKDNQDQVIATGTFGQVAGWGIDESNKPSLKLRSASMPATSYTDCILEAKELSSAVSNEKFCVLNKYSEIVCQGDSGGGFTVKKLEDNRNKHYLWGIVSGGVPSGRKCKEFEFVTYTNVQYYRDMIIRIESYNRVK